MIWHTSTIDEVFEELKSSKNGLSTNSARNIFNSHGPNQLPKTRPDSVGLIFLRQFKSPIIYILFISAFIVLAIGEFVDALIIFAVLIINAVIGAFQEGKAQNTMMALQNFVKTEATVARDGKEAVVSDEFVVPGDVLFLKEGDKIAADARIIDTNFFKIDESSLTGESEPVIKMVKPILNSSAQFSEQNNMVFRGTFVVSGSAKAVVVATGTNTEIGKISSKLQDIDNAETPLKANIRELSKVIIISVLSISAIIFILGISRGIAFREMLTTVVAISVSAIPEGLPIVVTLILAAGVYRMGKKNALVRKLQAVEALGQANIIAVDKTGTLTLNQMMVEKIYSAGNLYSVSGEGYSPEGRISVVGNSNEILNPDSVLMAGRISSFTAAAGVAFSEKNKLWQRLFGDPTEAALLVFSQKVGFRRDDLLQESPAVWEAPFDSNTRYHASINLVGDKRFLSVAGAPETVIPICTHIMEPEGVKIFGRKEQDKIQDLVNELSSSGLRVIALAYNSHAPRDIEPESLPNLTFCSLVAMSDSLRLEVPNSVRVATKLGIKVVMITGDHALTAKAVAKKAEIFHDGDEIVSGVEIDKLSIDELAFRLPAISIFARVSPEHKLKIIEAYKKRKYVIAMTGDGVNDALPLAAADLGVAMGKVGTEVAKEAADIILLDDNFNSIVSAVYEGRNIYATIRKVVLYLFATSLGEILTISVAIFFGLPLPVTASQIIWLNFITDGFLVLALAMEPKESLSTPPISRKHNKILDSSMFTRMFLQAFIMMVGSVILFSIYLPEGYIKASTVALSSLAIFQWFNAWNVRTDRLTFRNKLAENYGLHIATLIVIVLQLAAVYLPALSSVLKTSPLSIFDWLIIIVVSSSIVVVDSVWKILHKATIPKSEKLVS